MSGHDHASQHAKPDRTGAEGVEAPVESKILNAAYKKSGLTAADLAIATGMSVGAVRIALAGIRYRSGEPRIAVPQDQTLAKLSSVLSVSPDLLRSIGRERAAGLLAGTENAVSEPDLDTAAAVAARQALARQVLAVFSTDELIAELKRRQRDEHDRLDREATEDVGDWFRAATYSFPLKGNS